MMLEWVKWTLQLEREAQALVVDSADSFQETTRGCFEPSKLDSRTAGGPHQPNKAEL
jgi:hypothetical protein